MIQTKSRNDVKTDLALFVATIVLVGVGLMLVLDSSFVNALENAKLGNDAYFFVKRQAGGAIGGILVMLLMMRLGYWKLRRFAGIGMLIGLLLISIVLIPYVGHNENGAARWFKLGLFSFQPSEVAKLLLIIYLAARLARPECKVCSLNVDGLMPALLIAGTYLILIEAEPDLGTAIVLFLAVMTQIVLSGARWRHIALILFVATLAVALLAGIGRPNKGHYRAGRITSFLHPEQDPQGRGYQVTHSRLAIGSGEWFGQGFGHGREKYFLPQVNSDFIFATYAEETGFVGCCVLLGLMALVGWRGFVIAHRTTDRFGYLLAGGIAALISWQALINIAVATGTIPATGVPLPFISYGSSSMVLLMAGIGLLLNIAKYPTPPGVPPEKARRH